MTQITLDIEIPEGYELAEGRQPRIPLKDDWYTLVGANKAMLCNHNNFNLNAMTIILKKKEPEYKVIGIRMNAFDVPQICSDKSAPKYVEIKALEQALNMLAQFEVNRHELELCKKLRELTK